MLTTQPVPNKFPAKANGLAIIGESPGRDDVLSLEPFMGTSGRFLKAVLRKCNVDPNECFYGNVCQHQVPDFNRLSGVSEEMVAGLEQLTIDLKKFNPTVILCLGNAPLRAFFRDPCSVTTHRGSLFLSKPGSPCPSTKTLATYHPAGVLRQYDWAPLLQFDIRRAKEELSSPVLELPSRRIFASTAQKDFLTLIYELKRCKEEKVQLSVDIEGYVNQVNCIGFARSPSDCFVVPLRSRDGQNIWSPGDEAELIYHIISVLSDPTIPKTFQNGLYDLFVLAWTFKFLVRGLKDDTMLKHWELFCELEKNLGLQTSIYTREPYYKQERKDGDYQTYLTYCGKDCCVTAEINDVLEEQLLADPPAYNHYRFNMSLIPLFLYIELQGIRYNAAEAAKRREKVLEKLYDAQHEIDKLGGKAVPSNTTSIALILEVSRSICTVRAQKLGIWDAQTVCDNLLAPYRPYRDRLLALLSKEPSTWTSRENAEFNIITDRGINIRGGDYETFFYRTICEPAVLNEKGNPTTDYETVLRLFKKTKHPLCGLHLIVADCRTHESMLSITADADGRIRASYNPVGTVTGRTSCSESPTRSGYNLQTIPEDDRDLYLADPGYEVGQCDLKGADAWTVACWCAKLGDRTMLDDMLFGLAPAKILACMFLHGPQVSLLSRPELAELTNTVAKTDHIYFGSKCCQHGSNYGMGKVLVSYTIFKQSEGKIDLSSAVCETLQTMYYKRYWGVKLWHQHIASLIKNTQRLRCPNGRQRIIFGRPDDYDTVKQLLADEPQHNTTYATNLAARRLWYDPENRTESDGLIIKPLHQVHDALVCQWPIERREWALRKVREYFNNPMTIAGQTIVIPFEGSYGPAWGGVRTGKI